MSFVETFTYLTQALFFCVAVYVAYNTWLKPSRNNLFVLVFFALLALVIAFTWIQTILELIPGPVGDPIAPLLVMTLPYVLLRLAQDYSWVNPVYLRLAEAGLLASYLLIIFVTTDNPLIVLLLVSYFFAVSAYAAVRFYIGSQDANGITRKRLGALSLASVTLGVALLTATLTAVLEGIVSDVISVSRQVLIMLSAVLYLVGFTPPTIIRRSWQEPELRQFLRQTLQLPRWTSMNDALRYIEQATAETVGAPHGVIGLWNPETGLIDFRTNSVRPGETIGGRSFLEQRPILSLDTIADDPESREIYEQGQAFAVMAAPIFAEDGPIGVIALYSPNAPVFAEDDIALLSLLADQIGVLLENRRHLQAQAELAAREESTRLKDEFLSVAAHDLKTPLTTILATGQYLERRLSRTGQDSAEMRSIVRLNREAKRLRTLVQGLLDASRIERGQLLTNLETTNIGELLQDVVDRATAYGTHMIEVDVAENLIGEFDQVRIQQVVENLLENARKYSPPHTTIRVRAWTEGDLVRISVSDQGPGIHPDDHERVFDRYYRSPQADIGDAPGIGLGLYICREIVKQHGGDIWVESTLGEGATIHVSLHRTGIGAAHHDTVDTRS